MKDPRDVIIRPVVSEKSYALIELNVYTFEVHPSAAKPEIRSAIEEIFGVKVAKVNTISVRGRFRRQGAHAGYTAASKKAVVTLKADSKGIDFFESMV